MNELAHSPFEYAETLTPNPSGNEALCQKTHHYLTADVLINSFIMLTVPQHFHVTCLTL